MRYEEIAAESSLHPFIENYWLFTTDASDPDAIEHVIVPDGAVSLSCIAFPNNDTFIGLTGPSSAAFTTTLVKGAVYSGIRLRPGTAGSILKQDIQPLAGKMSPLAIAAPELAAVIAEKINAELNSDKLIAMLMESAPAIIKDAHELDSEVLGFADEIMAANGNVSLNALAEKSGLSQRQLRRRFIFQTGLTPKEFSRLRRVRQACIDLVMQHGKSLSEASLKAGFADQAHMAREFKQVFGSSTQNVLRYLRQIDHAGVTAA